MNSRMTQSLATSRLDELHAEARHHAAVGPLPPRRRTSERLGHALIGVGHRLVERAGH